jgi:hypothetical protein
MRCRLIVQAVTSCVKRKLLVIGEAISMVQKIWLSLTFCA